MNRYLLATLITATALQASAATALPYSESFDTASGFATMTVVDANGDGRTWYYNSYAQAAQADYSDSKDMDDWLILPAFSLQPAKTYTLELDAKCYSSFFGKEQFEIKMGTTAAAEAMTTDVLASTTLSSDKFQHFKQDISVTEAGTYYIGIHCTSAVDRRGIQVDNIALSAGVEQESPAAVADLTLQPDSRGLNKVTVSFTAPTTTTAGNTLGSISKMEVYRDKSLIKTFTTVAPGDKMSFVDETVTAGDHTYMVVAYSGTGRGYEASESVFVGPGIPVSVTDLVTTEISPGVVQLTWGAPKTDKNGNEIDPSLITYKVVTYEIVNGSYYVEEDLADNITTTSYTHPAIAADAGQKFAAYGVYAVTVSGKSDAYKTPLFPVGTSYATPFSESFADGNAATLWRSEVANYQGTAPEWAIVSEAEVSNLTSRDGDNGMVIMLGENENDCARFYSGKIDLNGLAVPALSFYVYNFGDKTNANPLLVFCSAGEGYRLIANTTVGKTGGRGWNKVIVPLTEFKDKVVRLVFSGTVKSYTAIPIDVIKVGERPLTDLAAVSMSFPDEMTAGEYFDIEVDVENAGTETVSNYTVELYRNGEKIQQYEGVSIDSCEHQQFVFSDCIGVVDNAENTYQARVVCNDDENPADNITAEETITVAMPEYPTVGNVKATNTTDAVTLTWDEPDLSTALPETTTDTFEDYTSFATTGVGGWTFADLDGAQVGKLDLVIPGITYEGSHQSFWVMDASMEGANASYAAHSGNKYLAQIFNYDNSQCDDWAISPELNGKAQTVSFFARSYSSMAGYAETFEVLYSTTGTDTGSFTTLGTYANVPNAWTRYNVALPEGAKYFAIRCISEGCYMLLIDDVTYTAAGAVHGLTVEGYNVYRNKEKLNSEPIAATQFTDANPLNSIADYVVTAVYNKGESTASQPVTVDREGSVSAIAADAPTIRTSHGTIIVDGAHGTVTVSTLSGAVVYNAATAHAEIPVLEGVYLVKAGTTVVKVIVK